MELYAEKEFFETTKVDQSLFDRTQERDKGTGTGKLYVFLVPSVELMKQYGIDNVYGKQDINYSPEMTPYLLYEDVHRNFSRGTVSNTSR